MDSAIVSALISAAATLLVAFVGKISIENISSIRGRARNNIAQIMQTRWAAEWCYEDGSLYVSDHVTFEKWSKGSRFVGYGEVQHGDKEYRYSIDGEIAPNRIVVLTYKAEKYPSQANIGIACLELSSSAEKLEGTWAGRASKTLADGSVVQTIRSGRIRMHKTKDLKNPR